MSKRVAAKTRIGRGTALHGESIHNDDAYLPEIVRTRVTPKLTNAEISAICLERHWDLFIVQCSLVCDMYQESFCLHPDTLDNGLRIIRSILHYSCWAVGSYRDLTDRS